MKPKVRNKQSIFLSQPGRFVAWTKPDCSNTFTTWTMCAADWQTERRTQTQHTTVCMRWQWEKMQVRQRQWFSAENTQSSHQHRYGNRNHEWRRFILDEQKRSELRALWVSSWQRNIHCIWVRSAHFSGTLMLIFRHFLHYCTVFYFAH